jgi:hypothetical protein
VTPASTPAQIEAAYVGNCAAGLVTGQESIRGQVVLSSIGLGQVPDHQYRERLRQRLHRAEPGRDDDLRRLLRRGAGGRLREAVPREQGHHLQRLRRRDRRRGCATRFMAANTAGQSEGSGTKRSMFADFYGVLAREYMASHGTELRHFAMVSAKNSVHGSLNPRAQFQRGGHRRGGAGTSR